MIVVKVYKYEDTFYEEMYFYYLNIKLLDQNYKDRFQNVEDADYHGTFYFAEKGIQILRLYYKDIIKYFENYLEMISKTPAKYDYEINSFKRIDN